MSVFEEASKMFPTAMIESIEDTDEMQDIVDKIQKTTVSSRCKISIYNLASRNENDEFDWMFLRRGRCCCSIFFWWLVNTN